MSTTDNTSDDIVYDQMIDLYHRLIDGYFNEAPLDHFEEIKKFYEIGGRMTKIRAIEILLRILQGRVISVTSTYSSKDEDELQEIEEKTHLQVVDWLEKTLMDENDEDVLTTFFIFIKSYEKTLSLAIKPSYKALLKLHKKLLQNIHYRKLASFDRLWFS